MELNVEHLPNHTKALNAQSYEVGSSLVGWFYSYKSAELGWLRFPQKLYTWISKLRTFGVVCQKVDQTLTNKIYDTYNKLTESACSKHQPAMSFWSIASRLKKMNIDSGTPLCMHIWICSILAYMRCANYLYLRENDRVGRPWVVLSHKLSINIVQRSDPWRYGKENMYKSICTIEREEERKKAKRETMREFVIVSNNNPTKHIPLLCSFIFSLAHKLQWEHISSCDSVSECRHIQTFECLIGSFVHVMNWYQGAKESKFLFVEAHFVWMHLFLHRIQM